MQRYDTRLEDGTLYVEWDGDWLDVGSMATIRELLGGETFEIEYDDQQATTPWLANSLEDNTLTFDVTETILGMDFNEEFVQEIAEQPLEETGMQGHPVRTEAFAEKMREIWESQGKQDDEQA
ncbi:MAG: hypothetical protein ACOCQY_01160 [Halorhabdus sp.]